MCPGNMCPGSFSLCDTNCARDVLTLVFRQSVGTVFAGAVGGTFAALAVSRVLERVVEGVQPTDAATFFLMIGILLASAMFAVFLPARRASQTDPMRALREQ